MRIIGIDLSGPSNHKDTVLSVFEQQDGQLNFIKIISNIGDLAILREIEAQSQLDEVVVGLDAPLSYEDGGGDRQADKLLRQYIVSIGMRSGSIMPPTLNRMVYLTLRGIKLSREIGNLTTNFPISIVEVHPGAVIGSRLEQTEREYVLNYKQNHSARSWVRDWLSRQKLTNLPMFIDEESHLIDACAAALGAWHWNDPSLQPKWSFPANPPLHPYCYCC